MALLSDPGRSQYDLKFDFGGFPTRINPFFWIIAALITWQPGNLGATAVGMVCVGFSILVHEFGHAFMAKRYGCRNVNILLYGMGGLAMFQGRPTSWQNIKILFAGPGAGFVLGAMALVARTVVGALPPTVSLPYLHLALHWLIWINMFWGLVNLVPLFPLDGGQICMNFLRMKKGYSGELLALKISIATCIALGVWAFTSNRVFLAMFCGYFAYENYQLMQRGGPSGGMRAERLESWQKPSDWWK